MILTPPRKKPAHHESKLQQACIRWFDYQYPKLRQLLFAIPNGGKRFGREAAIMAGEGVRSGVADLCLSVPKWVEAPAYVHHALYIEMKYGKNRQSPEQVLFQKAVEAQGYRYELVYDFDRFKEVIENYLKK